MAKYINLLVSVVNSLRAKGLLQHASHLDSLIVRNAQELDSLGDEAKSLENLVGISEGSDRQTEETPEVPTSEQKNSQKQPSSSDDTKELATLQHTLYYQFQKWHSVLDRELPKFGYLGETGIDAIRTALANVHKTFEQVIASRSPKYDKVALDKWNTQIEEIVKQMKKSQSIPVSKTKAIVDSQLLYNTTNGLYKQFQRLCGKDQAFNPVAQEFSNLIHTFTNVIQNNSEEIAGKDLTEVR